MELPSTLGNRFHNDVKPSRSQELISYPRTDQPFHGHPISKIAHAFASNKQRMQENLAKYINHNKTVQEQSCMQNQHVHEWIRTFKMAGIGHNTTVPSIMTHI